MGEKDEYEYEDPISYGLNNSSRKKLLKKINDDSNVQNVVDVDYTKSDFNDSFHEDPIGDVVEHLFGIHFGLSEAEKKKMKSKIEEEAESEKDYLDIL